MVFVILQKQELKNWRIYRGCLMKTEPDLYKVCFGKVPFKNTLTEFPGTNAGVKLFLLCKCALSEQAQVFLKWCWIAENRYIMWKERIETAQALWCNPGLWNCESAFQLSYTLCESEFPFLALKQSSALLWPVTWVTLGIKHLWEKEPHFCSSRESWIQHPLGNLL